jgi:hypothetical protein
MKAVIYSLIVAALMSQAALAADVTIARRDMERTEGSDCQGRRPPRWPCHAGYNGAARQHLCRASETLECDRR